MKPKNQVVIVTGAGRGIGKAIAQRCAAESAKVALVARTESTLQDVVDEIHGVGGKALVALADVSGQQRLLPWSNGWYKCSAQSTCSSTMPIGWARSVQHGRWIQRIGVRPWPLTSRASSSVAMPCCPAW